MCEAGCRDKVAAVKFYEKYNASLENVAYIGDDINDLDVIKLWDTDAVWRMLCLK